MEFLKKLRHKERQGAEYQQSFDLAYLLHPDKSMAMIVTQEGYERMSLIRKLEKKRSNSPRSYKMRTPDEALPQVGIYYASDHWERTQEDKENTDKSAYNPTAEDGIVRYIKFIVMNTMHRDSGNVAVGLGTLVYTYKSSDICKLAPGVFDDDNIRRDRKRIVDELKKRFKDEQISTSLKPVDEKGAARIIAFLKALAPWVGSHQLVAGLVPNLYEVKFSEGARELDWEVNHVLMDPECYGFAGLIHDYNSQYIEDGDEMRLDDPEEKLSAPQFDADGTNPNDRLSPPKLASEDIYLIRKSIKEKNHRRANFDGERLRIRVDGKEVSQFHAARGESQAFQVPRTASYIEIFGKDANGELLLGFFPLSSLDCFDSIEKSQFETKLEGGQRIECLISPEIEDGEIVSGRIQIKYRTPKLKAFFLWNGFRKPGRRMAQKELSTWMDPLAQRRRINYAAYGFVLLTVAILAISLIALFQLYPNKVDKNIKGRPAASDGALRGTNKVEAPQGVTDLKESQVDPTEKIIIPEKELTDGREKRYDSVYINTAETLKIRSKRKALSGAESARLVESKKGLYNEQYSVGTNNDVADPSGVQASGVQASGVQASAGQQDPSRLSSRVSTLERALYLRRRAVRETEFLYEVAPISNSTLGILGIGLSIAFVLIRIKNSLSRRSKTEPSASSSSSSSRAQRQRRNRR